jgi:hypothetical protein
VHLRKGKRFSKNFVVSNCIFHDKYFIMSPCYLQRTYTALAETEAHNLRPRPPRYPVENAQNGNEETDEENVDCEPIGDFLCANQGIIRCILLYLPA